MLHDAIIYGVTAAIMITLTVLVISGVIIL